ncbi:hypothetical protein EPN87_04410 [archaeon]|nr:MAG: hypothetical protein EPN87_04410 [archaeon]
MTTVRPALVDAYINSLRRYHMSTKNEIKIPNPDAAKEALSKLVTVPSNEAIREYERHGLCRMHYGNIEDGPPSLIDIEPLRTARSPTYAWLRGSPEKFTVFLSTGQQQGRDCMGTSIFDDAEGVFVICSSTLMYIGTGDYYTGYDGLQPRNPVFHLCD